MAVIVASAWAAELGAQESASSDGQVFIDLSSTEGAVCAVRANGNAVCYKGGYGEVNEAAAFSGNPKLRDISLAGGAYGPIVMCGVRRDHVLVCDGNNGLSDVPSGKFVAVDAETNHACAIDIEGRLTCWGAAVDAFVAASKEDPERAAVLGLVPGRWAPAGMYMSISVAQSGACALNLEGEAICWSYGAESDKPFRTRSSTTWSKVELAGRADGFVACGIRDRDGAVDCWGEDRREYLLGSLEGAYVDLAHNGDTLCAVDARGAIECAVDPNNPPEFSEPMRYIDVGRYLYCGVDPFDTIYCWDEYPAGNVKMQKLGD